MKIEQLLAEPLSHALTSTNALLSGPGRYVSHVTEGWEALLATQVPTEWSDEEYRQGAMEAHIGNSIAWQVRVNREERGMTQKALAVKVGTQQSAISKLEDPDGGDMHVSTLIKVAHAFDCALLVRFVSYSELAAVSSDVRSERLLANTFASEVNSLCRVANVPLASNALR